MKTDSSRESETFRYDVSFCILVRKYSLCVKYLGNTLSSYHKPCHCSGESQHDKCKLRSVHSWSYNNRDNTHPLLCVSRCGVHV